MKTVLVTGGGGYIGSHMVKLLDREGFSIITVDNLSNGFKHDLIANNLFQIDLLDSDAVNHLFGSNKIDVVIHFAGLISVAESVSEPNKYYKNNVIGTLNLLNAMHLHNVAKIIFSSTAAVYGHPQSEMIKESHAKNPINPYGKTKLVIEEFIRTLNKNFKLQYGILRYFNAAGADPGAELGERHTPETHLIPLTIFAALSEEFELNIFGNDYPTPDGTCIRDYVHVSDLCDAHLLVLKKLLSCNESMEFNLGNGKGYSCLDVVNAVEKISKKKVKFKFSNRRDGDPTQLVADSSLIREKLGWTPKFEQIETIIEHALNWETKIKRYR